MGHVVGIGLVGGEEIQILEIGPLLDALPHLLTMVGGDHLLDGPVDKPVHR
jgi:hypothetical protein